jgi:hypothetical protein
LVSELPTDGSTVFIRLWYKVGGTWQSVDEKYSTSGNPSIVSPLPGSELSGASEVLQWQSNNTTVDAWWVYAGSSLGSASYYSSGNLGSATGNTVTGLPTDGSPVYIRLWYKKGAEWLYVDRQYSARGNT